MKWVLITIHPYALKMEGIKEILRFTVLKDVPYRVIPVVDAPVVEVP